jgi:tetratricopeptide (TPR) repeat protein
MKETYLILGLILLTGFSGLSQTPSPTATPEKLSGELTAKLQSAGNPESIVPSERATAYAKLLEAQRNIVLFRTQRTQAGRVQFAELARKALVASLTADPFLSEPYVALAEIELMSASPDVEEAVALTSLAVKLNKDSIGGHEFLARLLTRQSGLRGRGLNTAVAARAIEEWRETARLEPRRAEAWAMLGELYTRVDKHSDAVEAYRRWMASTTPVDTI